jgi:hypothetical protein
MSTEKRPDSSPENFFKDFELPTNPPLERGDSPVLNLWAEGRMAIYASLDAAMTRHILEAVRSLTELKQQVEEDARQTIQNLSGERENLQREVANLRSEQTALQAEVRQTRQELEELHTQKYTVAQETQVRLSASENERDQLQQEVSRLTAQVEALRQQMQNFLEELRTQGQVNLMLPLPSPTVSDTVGFEAASVKPEVTESFPEPAEPFSLPTDMFGAASFDNAAKPFKLPTEEDLVPFEPPVEQDSAEPFKLEDDESDLQEFDDAPTPRIVGGSPVIRPDKFIFQPENPPTPVAQNGQNGRAGTNVPHLTIVPPPEPEPARTVTPEELGRASRLARTQAEQRMQRLFGKREEEVTPARPEDQLLSSTGTEAAQPAFNDKPTITPNRGAKRDKERDRAELEEIAAKLGFEVVTPPSLSAVRFGPGFKPRSSSGETAARKPSEEAKPPAEKPAEIAPFKPPAMPKPVDLSWATELFGDDSELESGNKETTPHTPSPRIGEIGDDLAQQFRPIGTNHLNREPLRLPDLDLPPLAPIQPLESLRQADFMPPPSMRPPEPMRRIPSIPLPPPPGGPDSEKSSEGDIETKLTISNLQGLSLLMMEKVVRGLPGVHHVTVTDFRKGVLEMDVRHAPDVKLDEVLPQLPDLKLTLVERGPNSLEFLQER